MAIRAESRIWFIPGTSAVVGGRTRLVVVLIRKPDLFAVGERADVGKRSRDDLIAGLYPGDHLEVLLAGDANLDRSEHRPAVTNHEYAFGFFARMSRRRFVRRRNRRFDAATLLRRRLVDQV